MVAIPEASGVETQGGRIALIILGPALWFGRIILGIILGSILGFILQHLLRKMHEIITCLWHIALPTT